MSEPWQDSVTDLLQQWSAGEVKAAEQVMPLLYDELHRIAKSYFRGERSDHTLQPTAIVHEAYLRLQMQKPVEWKSRAHFLGISARLMRQVLVDHARTRSRDKRGGGLDPIPLIDAPELFTETPPGILALDEALQRLAASDPLKASIVELRFFGGLTNDEIATCLSVSKATIVRQWRRAKAWLLYELTHGHEPTTPTP